jgi:hypothetical protein
MTTNPLVQIHADIVEKTLKNFYAYNLVNMTDFNVHESIYINSRLIEIPIEKLAAIYGFDEDMVNNILYCREIKKRCRAEFDKISKGINHPKKRVLNLYKVPGEKTDESKVFLLIFPSYYNNGFDYPIVKYLEDKGFSGSTVIRVPAISGYGLSHMLHKQLKEKKINVIINFYGDGASENSWYDFEHILYSDLKEPEKTELEKMLKNIPKNQVYSEFGGFDIAEVNILLQKL